jgi:hypothetical protein
MSFVRYDSVLLATWLRQATSPQWGEERARGRYGSSPHRGEGAPIGADEGVA